MKKIKLCKIIDKQYNLSYSYLVEWLYLYMLDSAKHNTELEKRILNQQNLGSFSLTKQVLIKIQEIIMSLATDETTDIIRKLGTSYVLVDSWTDFTIVDWNRWDYNIALFQLKDTQNYLLRVESKFIPKTGWYKNIFYTYQLTWRGRYDSFLKNLQWVERNARPSEQKSAKAVEFHELTRQLSPVSLKDIIFQNWDI
jgi:hypothetical protein